MTSRVFDLLGPLWAHAADAVIGCAYFTIFVTLIAAVRRRRDLLSAPLFWLFASLVLIFGAAHWLDLLIVWAKAASFRELGKAATALLSVVAAIMLWRVLPKAVTLYSPRQLREAHEALQKSEAFLDRTGRVAGIGGWEFDLATREISWSAETYRIHGVERDYTPELQTAIDFYEPQCRPVIIAALEKAAASGEGWDLELPFVRADGRRIWIRTVGSVEFSGGKPVRFVGAIQDVTARVAERKALEVAHERAALATDSSRIGIWDWEVVTDKVIWDPWMYRLYGAEPQDGVMSYNSWRQNVHPDDLAAAEEAVREGIHGTKPYDTEFRVVWSDGSVHNIRAFARVTRDSTGRALRMVGTNWDITESRQLGAELVRQAELQAAAAEREMALFRNSPDSLFVVGVSDTNGELNFVYEAFSPAFETLTGMRREDAVGHRPDECLPPDVAQPVIARYRRCVEERATIVYGDTYTLPIGTRSFEGSVAPVLHPTTGRVVRLVGAMRDVTERRKLEADLHHAHKLEAIGTLAAGAAHDFNNVLQTISGGLQLVLDDIPKGTSAHEYCEVALKAAMRGSSLTHHLLAYARKQILRPQAIEVAPLLADMRTLLARTVGPHIDIRVRADPTALVFVDPGHLQTALLNLAINASQAMPHGGMLSMEAMEEAECGQTWVRIAVTDTGMGMDPATLAHAVEPFFTTKGLEGSGLGLSMVQGFAEQSGGKFRIASSTDQGTIVELRLLSHPRTPSADS